MVVGITHGKNIKVVNAAGSAADKGGAGEQKDISR